MFKLLFSCLLLLFSFSYAESADISYDIKPDRVTFVMDFTKGYSNLDMLKSDKSIIFSFETTDKLEFKRQDFFDMPLTSAYLISDSFRKKFVVSFENELIEPVLSKGDKRITITFPLPKTVPVQTDGIGQEAAKPAAVPSVGSYFRVLFGLGIVLCIILFGYWFVKSYFKKQVFTDIPGSGRLLGKVDIEIRKSLFFYEIGDTIYIIGITDAGMGLIDKITDETEATKIRAGFVKKREFSGYMSFFKRKNQLDDDIASSNTLVREKLKSLQKK